MLSKSKGLGTAPEEGQAGELGTALPDFHPLLPTVAKQGLPLQEPAFQGQK